MNTPIFPKKVIRIHLTLTSEGLDWQETEWSLKESPKFLILTRTDVDGEKMTRHFEKSKFKTINRVFVDETRICYSTMTTNESIEESKRELVNAVTYASNNVLESINKLRSFIV